MKLFIYQLKQAYLSLKQSLAFSLSIITTMGITLGALLCVATLAYIMLFKPLPYPEQEQLHYVEHHLISDKKKIDGTAFTYPNLIHLYKNQTLFEQSALMYLDADVITSLENEPMRVINFVTPEWFNLFAIPLEFGRGFEQSEGLNTHQLVTVITYQTWQKDFAGSPDILDKSLDFGGKSFKIIGVVAKDYLAVPVGGASNAPQLYIPWDFNSVSEHDRQAWGNDDGSLYFIGKSNKQSTATPLSQSEQLTHLINNNWQNQVSDINFFKGWSINIIASPLKNQIIADSKTSVYLLLIGAIGLVVIAGVNIANLLLSRTAEKQQQLAICAALGATRKQLFSGILSEISLLMFAAIFVAQLVSMAGFSALHYLLGEYLPRISELSLNLFSYTLSAILVVLLTIFFALTCRRIINYRELNTSLQSSGKGNGLQVSKTTRQVLITSQIAVAATLIFINFMLFQDAYNLMKKPLGYQTENTYAVVLALPNADQSLNEQAITELKTNLLHLPKIEQVSQSARPTIFGTYALTTEHDNKRYTPKGKDVDHHYFELIEQPIIAGDNFTQAQIKDREAVMIVNDILAKQLAPTGSALGLTFTNGAKIIGVTKSIHVPGQSYQEARFYHPARLSRNMLLIKVKAEQKLTREEVISQLKAVDKQFSLFSFASLDEYKDQRLFSATTTAMVTIALTAITILLSAIGLYGILKYSSQMRRFEIGTRMAVGAKGKDIIGLIIKDNSAALMIGIITSLVILMTLYIAFSDALANYLTVELISVFITTGALISLISFFACYLPLRQYIKKPAVHCLRGSE